MKYTIITLNNDRKVYKDAIRAHVPYEEIELPAVDGREVDWSTEITERLIHHPGHIWGNPKLGEIGVWLSNYDRWAYVAEMDEPLIVFEDDAVVPPDFAEKLEALMGQLPPDWDFVALWVPENQRIDYLYDVRYEQGLPRAVGGMRGPETSIYKVEGSDRAALVYQGYGMVSLVYSPEGGRKLVALAREYGITGPVDCWIYEHAHMDELKGYAPRPDYADIVTYDWSAVSHVQLTEKAR